MFEPDALEKKLKKAVIFLSVLLLIAVAVIILQNKVQENRIHEEWKTCQNQYYNALIWAGIEARDHAQAPLKERVSRVLPHLIDASNCASTGKLERD